MKNKNLNILCCAVLTVLCVGCGQTSAQRNGATAKPPAPNKTMTVKATTNDATVREIDFRDAEAQLKKLKSYAVNYVYKDHIGDEAAQSAVTFTEYKKEINNESGDRHLFLNQQGGIAPSIIDAFQIAGQNYLAMSVPNLGKPSLTKMPAGSGEARVPFTPIDVCRATGFRTAHLVAKGEKIGDIAADHYRWDTPAAPSRWDLATLKGDVWLASDGGYVVKYLIEGKSVDTNQTHWEYTVEGIDSIGEIKLP